MTDIPIGKDSLTKLPRKPFATPQEFEKIRVEMAELRQDVEAFKIEVKRLLVSTFEKIIEKIEVIEHTTNKL